MGEILITDPLVQLYLLYLAALLIAHVWSIRSSPASRKTGGGPHRSERGRSRTRISTDDGSSQPPRPFGRRTRDSARSSPAVKRTRHSADDSPADGFWGRSLN
jgi:hypothetical protein